MISLSSTALAAIGTVCGLWLALALWALLRVLRGSRSAGEQVAESSRHLLLVVHPGGALEGDRAAAALGLETLPDSWSALLDTGIFDPDDVAALGTEAAAAAAAGGSFTLAVRPVGARRILQVVGGPAPL